MINLHARFWVFFGTNMVNISREIARANAATISYLPSTTTCVRLCHMNSIELLDGRKPVNFSDDLIGRFL